MYRAAEGRISAILAKTVLRIEKVFALLPPCKLARWAAIDGTR